MKNSAQSMGGKVMAIRQRETAEAAYYASPNLCKNCGEVIHVKPGVGGVGDARRRVFCCRRCSAKYNNPRRVYGQKTRYCKLCGVTLPKRAPNKCTRVLCQACYESKFFRFSEKKKRDVSRREIASNAAYTINSSAMPKVCIVCGYNKHVEVSHIVPVAEFGEDVLVRDINALANLVYLCPNCHWEFDNH